MMMISSLCSNHLYFLAFLFVIGLSWSLIPQLLSYDDVASVLASHLGVVLTSLQSQGTHGVSFSLPCKYQPLYNMLSYIPRFGQNI